MSGLKLIRGMEINDSNLVSDVPENDETEWDSTAVPYALDAVVMVTTTANGAAFETHKIYKSTANDNNEDPTLRTTYDDGGEDVFWWDEISSTNRYKMFDDIVQDQTVQEDGFEVTITSSMFASGVAFLNVSASTIEIEYVDGVDVVFSQTYNMVEPTSQSGLWWWLFEPIERKTDLFIDGFAPILGAELTATFTGEGDVACGIMRFGESFIVGQTIWGGNYSIFDYSVKEVDNQGRATIERGPFRNIADVPIVVYDESYKPVFRKLAGSRGEALVWFIDDNKPLVFGFYDRFDLMYANPAFSELVIRIEGLT